MGAEVVSAAGVVDVVDKLVTRRVHSVHTLSLDLDLIEDTGKQSALC